MLSTTQAVQHSTETLREATTPQQFAAPFPPLALVNKPNLTTAETAYYLNRREQTLRGWACKEDGPLRPMRISGRLAWPVSELRRVLGVTA